MTDDLEARYPDDKFLEVYGEIAKQFKATLHWNVIVHESMRRAYDMGKGDGIASACDQIREQDRPDIAVPRALLELCLDLLETDTFGDNRRLATEQLQAHLGPESTPQPGEWIAWEGGRCPLSGIVHFEFKLRSGFVQDSIEPGRWGWEHGVAESSADIVAYRILKPAETDKGEKLRCSGCVSTTAKWNALVAAGEAHYHVGCYVVANPPPPANWRDKPVTIQMLHDIFERAEYHRLAATVESFGAEREAKKCAIMHGGEYRQ